MICLHVLIAGIAILCWQAPASDPVREAGNWLALAPAEWEADLAPLVAARAAQGWTVRFVALEDALAAPPPPPAPLRPARCRTHSVHSKSG